MWLRLCSGRWVGNNRCHQLWTRAIGGEMARANIASIPTAHEKQYLSYSSPHSKEQCVNQNRNIHKEAAISDVIEVVLDVFVDWEGPISA